MNILLIEDNLSIIKGLKYSLENNGYKVSYKTNIKDAKEYLNDNVDLIVLDITLGNESGVNLYKDTILKLNIPTIFLTACDEEETIVKCLELGAEDYVTKPFSTKELIVRINKILCRVKKNNIINIKNIKFDIDKMEIYKDDIRIEFTSLELKILSLLFLNINKVVSRNIILDTIWNVTGNDVDDHTVTVYIKRIKDKLDTNIITTIKGIGYRIDVEK